MVTTMVSNTSLPIDAQKRIVELRDSYSKFYGRLAHAEDDYDYDIMVLLLRIEELEQMMVEKRP